VDREAFSSLTTDNHISVPVIAALGGIIILGESLTVRFMLAFLAILGGKALVILSKSHRKNA
jgi:threonine/homoserine efflux transporter RhtA